MSDSDVEFKLWKEQRDREKILQLVGEKGTIDITQICDLFGSTEYTSKIVKRLEEDKLIQRKVGNIYQLTSDGYRRIRSRQS